MNTIYPLIIPYKSILIDGNGFVHVICHITPLSSYSVKLNVENNVHSLISINFELHYST